MHLFWSRQSVRTRSAVATLALLAGVLNMLSGCGGNSGGTSLLAISPTTTTTLDAGQTVVLSASIVNDVNNAGVTWALTTGPGSIGTSTSNNGTGGTSTFNTIVYTAPATVAAATNATVTATSVHTPSLVGTFNIVINPGVAFTTASPLPTAIAGTAYTTTIATKGGAGTISVTTTSTLPAGLSLSKTGVLSGTPTTAGSYTLSVVATDQAPTPQAITQSYTLNIAPAITTTSVPNAVTGAPYVTAAAAPVQLAYAGGGTPVFAITAGSLPASSGLTLSSTGLLSGTPAAGTSGTVYSFSVVVTVGGVASAAVNYSITVTSAVAITTPPALPGGTFGVTYTPVQLASSGGTGTGYTYALLTGGTPAPGLLVSASGVISFATTPTKAGSYSFPIRVADSAGTQATQTFTLVIAAAPLTIATASLPPGVINVTYSQQLAIAGGDGSTPTFAISSGSLTGSGLTLSSAGLISGKPIASGTYTFSVTATQPAGSSPAKAFTITISTLSITSGTTASGEVNLPFSFPETEQGGTGPYTWKIATTGAALPAGLTISSSTGQISGTPTTVTTSPVSVVVMVTDSMNNTGTQTVAITINAARTSVDSNQFVGQYAFLLSGYDATSQAPLTWAGKFTADGLGNILTGVLDTNGLTQTQPGASIAITGGSYVLGADNRGRLTLTTASGSTVFVMAMNKATSGVTSLGYLTEFDASGQSLTGSIALEDPTAFNVAALTGGYTFGLSGFNGSGNGHVGAIGEVQLSAGTVSSSEYISTLAGLTPVVPTSATFTMAANGRGTLVLTSSSGTISLVVYVVSAKQLFLVSSVAGSSAPVYSGQALVQTVATGSFTGTNLNASSVARIERLVLPTTSNTYVPDMSVGVMNFTTAGRIAFSGDENQGGNATQFTYSGSPVVAANGRGSVPLAAGLSGCVLCSSTSTYFYLVGNNQGFLLDFQGGNGTGYFEPQSTTTFTAAAISGTYVGGTVQPLAQASIYGVRALNAAGTAPLTGTQDFNIGGLLIPDVAFSATYTVAANGRTVIVPNDGTSPVFYLVSPTKAIRLDTTATSPILQEIVQ